MPLIKKYFPQNIYSEEGIKQHLADIFHGIVDRLGKTAEFIKDRKKVDRTIEEKMDLINGEWSNGSFLEDLTFREGEVKFGGRFPINTLDKTKPEIDKVKKMLIVASRENKILVKRRAKILKKAIEFIEEDNNLLSPATINDYRKALLKNLGHPDNNARDNKSIAASIASLVTTVATSVIPVGSVKELANNPYRLVQQDKYVNEFFESKVHGKQALLNRDNFDDHVDFVKGCIEVIESFTSEPIKEWDREVGEWFPIDTFGEISDFDKITTLVNSVAENPKFSKEAKDEFRQFIDEVIFREFRYFVTAIWGKYNKNLRFLEKTTDRFFNLCQSSYE